MLFPSTHRFLLPFLTLFLCYQSAAQVLNPVKWSFSSERSGKNEYILYFTADIEPGWHTYSQFIAEGGPVPTSFSFTDNPNVERIGKVVESGPKMHEVFDKVFEMNLKLFDEKAIFSQKVKIKSSTILEGSLEFMVCDDSRCLPPDQVPFSFTLQSEDKTPAPADTLSGNETNTNVTIDSAGTATGTPSPLQSGETAQSNVHPLQRALILDKINVQNTEADRDAWMVFLLGIIGGLFALFTPCVFPMIPLTVSFFTKGNDNQKGGKGKAFLYGFFIFLIYVLLSVPFHLFQISPDVLNEISTNVWLNLSFFIIFVVFALSFFGFYEIQLPASLANRMSSAEQVGGYLGVFFMAATLAIVSFSCTGPIIGSLLAGTLSKGAGKLTAGMAGFGLALGLPFGLFALFPKAMDKLPRSGGWLNSVKVVLGFLELALAVKFLSNADLVAHWGLLKVEVFLGIWIVIGLATVLYLLGILRFPHDHGKVSMSPLRWFFTAVFTAFTLYLCTGLTGKPLELLSGFPPPMYYSFSHQNPANENAKGGMETSVREANGMSADCPHDLPCFKDFFRAAAYAQKVQKPILIDFTGYACVNCRRMEENIWPKEGILDILNNEVVLVSLYVDDKQQLPAEEQFTLQHEGYTKAMRTVGNKWSAFEVINFKSNTQPLYVMLSPTLDQVLMEPVGYTPDAKAYKKMLEDGIRKYKALR